LISFRDALEFLDALNQQAEEHPDDYRLQDIDFIADCADKYPNLGSREAIYLTLFKELGMKHPRDLDQRKWSKLNEMIDNFYLQ